MISVVIPSYNGAETLFQAIDSVLCQTTKTPLEILVIDDNSTDDTLEKMGRYGENDRVRYIRNETNKGASASRMITGIPKNWKSRKKPLQRPVMCSAVRVGS